MAGILSTWIKAAAKPGLGGGGKNSWVWRVGQLFCASYLELLWYGDDLGPAELEIMIDRSIF